MTSFLVVYGTGEGQTAKVADRIVEVLVDRGHDARAADGAAFIEGDSASRGPQAGTRGRDG